MSYGKAVRDELRVPTRELRHAIPQVYAGYKELYDAGGNWRCRNSRGESRS